MPVLKKKAKEICKDDWRGFLKAYYEKMSVSHEENLLCAFVVAQAPCDFTEKWSRIQEFVPRIENWAVCDSLCAAFKAAEKNKKEVWEKLKAYIQSEREFERRFAVCMLMDYFLCEEYIGEVLNIFATMNSDGYYCQMALAWALSVSYVKFPEKTEELLKKKELPVSVQNKCIQKIRESRRVSETDKKNIAAYKL